MIKYTELKSTNRQNLMDVLPLDKPFTVLIEPSSLCNFRCVQCFHSIDDDNYFTRRRMNMPLSLFQRVIEQLKSWKGDKIKVLKLSLYGEPLINPNFCEMLRIAAEAEVAERIETTTNASLLSRDIAEKLVLHRLDYMRVSIYATEQLKHDRMTHSAIDMGCIHENLRILQEIKRRQGSERPFAGLKMLESGNDVQDAFVRMYRDVADELYFDKPHGWINVDDADFLGRYCQGEADAAGEGLKCCSTSRIACPMPFTTMAIRSDGAVSPCCVDYIGGTNLGNVDESDLQEIWRSDAWIEFQRMQLQNRKNENYSCARCEIFNCDYYIKDNIDGFPVEKLRLSTDATKR